MIATCAFLLALSLAQPPQQTDTAGRLAGRVTVERNRRRRRRRQRDVVPAGRPTTPMGMPPQAVTDHDGRFAFDRITPGTYNVEVQKTGFVPLNRTAGAIARQRGYRLPAASRRSTCSCGAAASSVAACSTHSANRWPTRRVVPMQRLPPDTLPGNRIFPAGPGAQTNDLGEFRIASLAAGESSLSPHRAARRRSADPASRRRLLRARRLRRLFFLERPTRPPPSRSPSALARKSATSRSRCSRSRPFACRVSSSTTTANRWRARW